MEWACPRTEPTYLFRTCCQTLASRRRLLYIGMDSGQIRRNGPSSQGKAECGCDHARPILPKHADTSDGVLLIVLPWRSSLGGRSGLTRIKTLGMGLILVFRGSTAINHTFLTKHEFKASALRHLLCNK